jgi:hypothetical protein
VFNPFNQKHTESLLNELDDNLSSEDTSANFIANLLNIINDDDVDNIANIILNKLIQNVAIRDNTAIVVVKII